MAPAREAVTIRFPKEVLEQVRKFKPEGQSFNEFVVDVVAREARLQRGREALARIDELREKIYQRTGPQPSSAPIIRAAREERMRRYD